MYSICFIVVVLISAVTPQTGGGTDGPSGTKDKAYKQKKRLKMKSGDPNLEKFTYILYQSPGVNLT
jgi:hypothetical protein